MVQRWPDERDVVGSGHDKRLVEAGGVEAQLRLRGDVGVGHEFQFRVEGKWQDSSGDWLGQLLCGVSIAEPAVPRVVEGTATGDQR